MARGKNVRVDVSIKFDRTELDKLIKELKFVDTHKVKVGVLNNAEQATKAMVHELGSIKKNIPARSFIKEPLERELPAFYQEHKFNLKEPLKDYEAIGARAVEIIQEAFETSNNGEWQALKPATIKRKGSDKPLIDTGVMRQAIRFKVVKVLEKR